PSPCPRALDRTGRRQTPCNLDWLLLLPQWSNHGVTPGQHRILPRGPLEHDDYCCCDCRELIISSEKAVPRCQSREPELFPSSSPASIRVVPRARQAPRLTGLDRSHFESQGLLREYRRKPHGSQTQSEKTHGSHAVSRQSLLVACRIGFIQDSSGLAEQGSA